MAGFDVDVWGTGERVVLVHGSFATGPEEWVEQRPLAEEGYQLVVPTRAPYATQPVEAGEDFRAEGAELVELLEDGAHLVGHSSGGLVALAMASAQPEKIHSLALAEPPLFSVAANHNDVADLRQRLEAIFSSTGTDREFVQDFLAAVGTPLDELPPAMLDELAQTAPAVRRGPRPSDSDMPLDVVADASFPTLVISGNHHPGFTAIAEALAQRLHADYTAVHGAGHEMQTVADDFNAALLRLWHTAR